MTPALVTILRHPVTRLVGLTGPGWVLRDGDVVGAAWENPITGAVEPLAPGAWQLASGGAS